MELTLDKLLAVVTALPDPLFILTESGHYAGLFGGGDRNYYHDGSGLVGSSLYDVLPKEKADWFLGQIRRTLDENKMRTVEYGLSGNDVVGLDTEQGPSGEIRFEGRIQPLQFPINGERAVVWTARNITQRYQLELQLRYMSEVDDLTGAYNRRKLLEELEIKFSEFLRYGTPTSLLMLDIDHFKQVNDRYGHLAGDEVLRETVALCQQQLRDPDMFSRFGGEEFVVLLPQTKLAQAMGTAERLLCSVGKNVISSVSDELQVTISIGVSTLLESDRNFESVIKRIDDALYHAKRTGRNRISLSPMDAAVSGSTPA